MVIVEAPKCTSGPDIKKTKLYNHFYLQTGSLLSCVGKHCWIIFWHHFHVLVSYYAVAQHIRCFSKQGVYELGHCLVRRGKKVTDCRRCILYCSNVIILINCLLSHWSQWVNKGFIAASSRQNYEVVFLFVKTVCQRADPQTQKVTELTPSVFVLVNRITCKNPACSCATSISVDTKMSASGIYEKMCCEYLQRSLVLNLHKIWCQSI